MFMGSLLGLALAAGPASAQLRSVEDPAPNPDLERACGLNVLMILDESGSINSSGATNDVRAAFKAFTDAIKNTSSAMAVAEFSSEARLPAIGPFDPGEYIIVTDDTKEDLDRYVDDDYNPGGKTNWEDGFRMGIPNFANRENYQVPHLTVMITDGEPTRVIRDDRVNDFEYANQVPLSSNQTTDASNNPAADRAIRNANDLKGQGSHILAIAVGNGLSSGGSLDRLIRVSGPDVFDGTGEFDITTDDIYREPDFSRLQDALREAAFQLCAPSVTIEKLVDLTPDPDTLEDAVQGEGWTFDGTVTPPPGASFDWVLPESQSPATGPLSGTTDATGFVTFQWTPDRDGESGFTAIETPQPGFSNLPDETVCTFRTPDSGDEPLAIQTFDGSRRLKPAAR